MTGMDAGLNGNREVVLMLIPFVSKATKANPMVIEY